MSLKMKVNGQPHQLAVAPDTPLLHVLRNDPHLTAVRIRRAPFTPRSAAGCLPRRPRRLTRFDVQFKEEQHAAR
jgi:hypothetical protein